MYQPIETLRPLWQSSAIFAYFIAFGCSLRDSLGECGQEKPAFLLWVIEHIQ